MKPAFKALLLLGMLLPSLTTHAQGRAPWEEFENKLKASQQVTALGDDMFGDTIALANGGLSFTATDIDLPGTNALPVRLGRRYSVYNHWRFPETGSPLADWDLDVPNLSAVFAPDWTIGEPYTTSTSGARCTSTRWPTMPPRDYRLTDFFHGVQLNIPGVTQGELLRPLDTTPLPASGGPYHWITTDHVRVSCLPNIKNGTGEGFLAITADGTKYWFDWMAQYSEPEMAMVGRRSPSGFFDPNPVPRKKNVLYATKVRDRFGNTVTYAYANAWNAPARLDSIVASDGRQITLTYNGPRLVSASSAGRTWAYAYDETGRSSLSRVTLPDGNKWTIAFKPLTHAYMEYRVGSKLEPARDCLMSEPPINFMDEPVGTITHPSGATATYRIGIRTHGRSNVPISCLNVTTWPAGSVPGFNNDTTDDVNRYVITYDSFTLLSKSVTGPSVSERTWNYAYQANESFYFTNGATFSYPVCNPWSVAACVEPRCTSDSCAGASTTTVVDSSGRWTRYHFGNSYRYNEGKLLKVEEGTSEQQIARTTAHQYDLSLADQAYPFTVGESLRPLDESFVEIYTRPLLQTTLQQDGAAFTSNVPMCGGLRCFDTWARPLQVQRSSSVGYTKTDTTEYHDDLNAWVLGQVKRTATNGIETSRTDFDARSQPWRQYAFGKLQHTFTYHADGSLATATDGNSNTTTLTNWKRGIPQSIQYADGTSQSAVVNDNGWITSVTDQNGFVSQYDYDAMGRMTALFYPTGDSTAWNPVSIQFNQIPHADRGLPAGHWRQDRFEGNRHTHTYFDALWRPVMTLDYDAASAGHNVQTQTITRYDTQGRVAFKSYPARHVGDVNASLPGTHTQYDALDRVTRVEQDSEHGPLVTTTEYLPGNSIRTTNPRGHATTSHYVAYDQPAYDLLAWSAQPEGRTIEIHRDVFGKPLWMRQRAADNSAAAIRHFVYDTHQQLCKSIEPETGATVMDYDAAGNLAWTASGLNLPSTTDCNFNEAWYSGRRSDRGYDNRNRLSTLAFADGRGNQQWQYTADGLPAQITTWNTPGNANPVINAYTYNKRRLLTGESVTQPGWYSWSLGYGYNANGQLASQVYPDGFTVNYSPNALGQPTEVRDASGKAYASNVSYYPNGGMSSFTYGNGVVHGMQQNLRQLPERSIDNGVINFGYAYDAAANPTAIYDDQLGPAYHRSMQYDALDRLTAVGSASFGGDHWHRFTYNALDNLTSWTLAGVKDYAIYGYDANNRLTDIRNTAGATVVGLGYDVQGNLANKNGQQYTFDMGNRLREVQGKESYRYDGHGRRVQSTATDTGHVLSLYSSTGTLMRQESERTGRKENMIHLNGSLIAKHVQTTPPLPPASAPVLTAPTQANSGDFNLSWTSVERATRYVLEENPNSAGWTALQDGAGLNRAVTGKPPGSYVYRVKACNTSGCSAESAVKTVTVPNAPANAPNLTTPASSTTGNYVVSWSGPATASRHVLEENANGAGWVGIHDGTGFSRSVSGKASGNYAYRVKGCNAGGCGPYSTEKTVVVAIPSQPPVQPPTITQSVSMHRGRLPEVRCGVQWTAVANAAHYELKASTGAVQYQGPNTYAMRKDTSYCAPSHVVRACNSIGCSAWSSPPFNQVEIPWTDRLPGVP